MYLHEQFSNLLGKDLEEGEINYEKIRSGISHGSTTVLNLPAQKIKINAQNHDYSQRVK
jgi:hypothetical protein